MTNPSDIEKVNPSAPVLRDRLDLDALENVSDEDRALYNGYNSAIAFGKMYLPGDYMRSENSPAHYLMDAELQLPTTIPAVFIVSREHMKTTLIKANIVRDFCYNKTNMERFAKESVCVELKNYWIEEAGRRKPHFIGWVADRQKKSQSNVLYIKQALTLNPDIVGTFGNMNGKPKGYQWTTEDIVTSANDKLVSRSNLTSIRGETHSDPIYGTIRYTWVYADDFENEENTRSVKKREFVANVLMNAIWGAIDKDHGRLVINQTPVHWASLAQQFMEMKEKEILDPELSKTAWHIYVFPATQPTYPGGVLWHGHYPREKLDRIKSQYIVSPKGLQGYMQEYELQVQTAEVSTWTQSHIQTWKGTFTLKYGFPALIIDNEVVPVNTFGGCDPATDIDKATSDFSVILTVAMDSFGNYYVLNYIRERALKEIGIRDKNFTLLNDPGVCDVLVEEYDKWQMSACTVEDVGMTRGVFNGLNTLMTHMGNFNYSWCPEPPGGRQKRNKIKTGLASPFAMRKIFLLEGMIDLMYEIKTFGPNMAHDDIIEALFFSIINAYPPTNGRLKVVDANYMNKNFDKTRRYRRYEKQVEDDVYRKANPWDVGG